MQTFAAADAGAGASMRQRSHRPEVEATRLQILRAAERLFSSRGFDGASLREIAIAARQGNNNAVQYHFGGRDSLIEAIFHQRLNEMEAECQALLDRAGEEGQLGDVSTLLSTLCLPHLSLRDDHGHHPHAGFLLHYLVRRMPEGGVQGLGAAFSSAPVMHRVVELIHQCVSFLPRDIARTRITLGVLMFLHLLVQHDAAHPAGSDPVTLARHATDTIHAMTAALCAPFSAEE